MKRLNWTIRKILAFALAASILIGTVNSGVYADELNEVAETETVAETSSDNESYDSGTSVEDSASSDDSSQTEEAAVVLEVSQAEEVIVQVSAQTEEPVQTQESVVEEIAVEETAPSQETAQSEEKSASSHKEKGDVENPDGETPNGETPAPLPIYTVDDVSVNFTGEPTRPNDGAQNGYKFFFNLRGDDEETVETYSAYVYGNGVDEDVCKQLAAAYFSGLYNTKDNSTVTNPKLTDADKTTVDNQYNVGYDSELCWAYSASNALWQTDWMKKTDAGIFNMDGSASGYFKTEDDLSSYAAYCFKDRGDDETHFWSWIFTGYFPNEEKLVYGADEDDALLNEYYERNIYGQTNLSTRNKDILNEVLSTIENNDVGATIGIYGDVGGHAMTITGFIRDAEGNPVAVIVADSDNEVLDETQSDIPYLKDNTYSVFPIEFIDGSGWILKADPQRLDDYRYYTANIGDISVLKNSEGKDKVNASRVPEATRGISDSFDNDREYDLDSNYGLDIPLNADFLSYYDISLLKYKVFSENGDFIEESAIRKPKSVWKDMISNGISNITLSFGKVFENLTDGKYKVEVEVDQDSFEGNYGWFAKRYNNNNGYFDRLVSVFVNLFREKPAPTPVEEAYAEHKSHDKKHNTARQVEAKETNDNTEITEKSELRMVVNDLAKAMVSDPASVSMFKSIGIDVSKVDIEKLNIVMSTPMTMSKAGTVRFNAPGLRFSQGDIVFALVYLADGTTTYVKGTVLADGSIEFAVPANIVAITVFSI